MDREQTPLKQRQKRGAARTAGGNGNGNGNGASERAFRSSGVSQRGRAKVSAGAPPPPAPAALMAKPPLTILRASSSSSAVGGGGSHPPSPSASTTVATPTKTLYSPPPPPPPSRSSYTQQQQQPSMQRNGSGLRVNTAPPSYASPSPSPSPLAVTGTPRKPSTPGGASASAHAPPVLLQRPSASSLLPPLVSAPPAATKLITSSFQFASDIPTRLAPCLELTNFMVVGTLGFEGAGKSTLLSLLARLAFASRASSAQALESVAALRDRTKNPLFLAQRLETQLAGLQETQGVDLAVACEAPRVRANTGGLVLLDTQPLLSASHLAEALARAHESSSSAAAAAARYGALSPEQQLELASVQIAVLLLSVCHYVVVPVRGAAAVDLEMVAFLRKVHDKMQQCRLPNVSGHVVKDKHHAQLLFVANETPSGDTTATDSATLRALTRVLPPEWVYRSPETETVPLWKLETLNASATPRTVEDWRAHALQWARFVEALPASPSFTKQTPASEPTAPTPLTLKEWLSSTARVWESVKRSSALTEEYTTRDHY